MLQVPRGYVVHTRLLTACVLAIITTGLALVAPMAHLYELDHKIHMGAEQYFIVQGIYRGWWMLGVFLALSFVANAALATLARHDRTALVLALIAASLIALNLVIFFIWTQPTNAATANWTVRPDNWDSLRRQWEYSHAVNAGVTFAAFCAATLAGLRAARSV